MKLSPTFHFRGLGLAIALALAATQAAATGVAPVAASATDAEAALDARVIAWRRDIHQHPELSNREFRTSKLVFEHLRKLGLQPRMLGGTGVIAIVHGGKPGPRIALRADMDALPVTELVELPFASKVTAQYNGQTVGVMHACGHDAHTAILMGVAEQLAAMRKDLPGEVMLVFQPAEEGAPEGETGGAQRLLAEGLFADFKPVAMFGLHVNSTLPVGEIGWHAGAFMAAADSFKIVVTGRGSHGARPWLGADPILAAAEIVVAAQSIVSRRLDITRQPAVLTVGSLHGGNRSNIIPDTAEMIGTIRTFDPRMREQIFEELKRVATHVAAAHDTSAEVSAPNGEGIPTVVNDPALLALSLPALQRAGADSVHEIGVSTGAEDFALYARQVPSLFIYVGSTAPGIDPASAPGNHSPRFALDERSLGIGRRALLAMALDALGNPSPPAVH
ncbi:MAG: amidohydrolase [Arenimonas sp.]